MGSEVTRKTLLVGHSTNPKSSVVKEALDPSVPGGSGWRLLVMSGMDEEAFKDSFDRVNTSPIGPVSRREMRERAASLTYSGLLDDRRVLLVGEATSSLYDWRTLTGARRPDPMTWVHSKLLRSEMAWVHHPSGLCRFWNDRANRDRLALFMHSAVYTVVDQ